MLERCGNPNNKNFSIYGGRGITVCDEWKDFSIFFADMGKAPSSKHSIDRIDNSLGYSPDNCRWATQKEQVANSRHPRMVEVLGETKSVTEWAEITGTTATVIRQRIHKLGWPAEDAVLTPKNGLRRYSHKFKNSDRGSNRPSA